MPRRQKLYQTMGGGEPCAPVTKTRAILSASRCNAFTALSEPKNNIKSIGYIILMLACLHHFNNLPVTDTGTARKTAMPEGNTGGTVSNPVEASRTTPPSRARMITGAVIGNALEYYDFTIYGFFATSIAAAFFPGQNATAKLLLTFGVFGVSFFARPVGALVLGTYADRRGRTASLTLAISLTTLAGAIITLMPGCNSIGIAAPIGILLARLIQGFALGGEYGSATALMIEHSPNGEARAASWQAVSQNFAGLFASGIAWLFSSGVTAPLLHLPAFRIAFGLGVLAGPIALALRRGLQEAPVFLAQRYTPPPREARTLSGIAIVAGMLAIGTAQTYLVVYLPTYATTQLHVAAGSALGAVFLLYAATLALTPFKLAIASRYDRSRRSLPMLLASLVLLASGYPAFILLGLWPGPVMLFLLPFSFTIIGLFYGGPMAGIMGLIFSVRRRGIGLSVGYSLGIALFGGSAPFINTWLIAHTGNPRSPGLYLIFASLISLIALLAARRRLLYGTSDRPAFQTD
jgi:MHS family proline/betaine transporter-like MFS transporter